MRDTEDLSVQFTEEGVQLTTKYKGKFNLITNSLISNKVRIKTEYNFLSTKAPEIRKQYPAIESGMNWRLYSVDSNINWFKPQKVIL